MDRSLFVPVVWLGVGLVIGSAATAWVVGSGRILHHEVDSVVRSGIDAGELRSVMRQELAVALANAARSTSLPGQPSAVLPPAAPLPAAVTLPQRREALQAASAIVAAGQWGPEERLSFHQQLTLLDAADREQAMQELVHAIDNGSIRLSPDAPFL